MIYDHICSAKNYSSYGEALTWALEQLARPDLKDMPVGKTEFIPGKAWLSIQETTTKPLNSEAYEAHRNFIDVQMTLVGDEVMAYAPLCRAEAVCEYDAPGDIQHFKADGLMLDCTNGMFAIFFPEDAHRPCVAPDGKPQGIKKAVAKIHVSLLKK